MDVFRGRGHVVNAIETAVDRDAAANVGSNERKSGLPQMNGQVSFRSRAEIVQRDHGVPIVQKTLAEIGADEAGAAGDEDAHGLAFPCSKERGHYRVAAQRARPLRNDTPLRKLPHYTHKRHEHALIVE